MTPEQEEEFNDTALSYRATPGVQVDRVVREYRKLCALVDKYIQQAEDAAFEAGRETVRYAHEIERRYKDVNEWRKARKLEEAK